MNSEIEKYHKNQRTEEVQDIIECYYRGDSHEQFR